MDLREPLVRSGGSLDPADGLVVSRLLRGSGGPDSAVPAEEIGDYEKIVSTKWEGYNGSDPLDLGMALWTACCSLRVTSGHGDSGNGEERSNPAVRKVTSTGTLRSDWRFVSLGPHLE
jgi:hypothetical protein